MRNHDNVYYKYVSPSGKVSYKPFGVTLGEHYLPDGIWYIHHNDCSVGTTNVNKYLAEVFRVGEPYYIDIPSICGQCDCKDFILNHEEFKPFMNGGWTWNDLVSKIVALTCEFKRQQNDKTRADK